MAVLEVFAEQEINLKSKVAREVVTEIIMEIFNEEKRIEQAKKNQTN
jgi:hypothetical protein